MLSDYSQCAILIPEQLVAATRALYIRKNQSAVRGACCGNYDATRAKRDKRRRGFAAAKNSLSLSVYSLMCFSLRKLQTFFFFFDDNLCTVNKHQFLTRHLFYK